MTYDCDLVQGFAFQADLQTQVGYITALTIGSTSLPADLTGTNPISLLPLSAVGVLSMVEWKNEQWFEPINFTAQISLPNEDTLAALLREKPSSLTVNIGFVVFDYEPVTKQYFKAFSPGSTDNLNGSTSFEVASERGTTVESPKNFELKLMVAPDATTQTIIYATAAKNRVLKAWQHRVVPPVVRPKGLSEMGGEDR